MIHVRLNGKLLEAKTGETILQLAQRNGYEIPNLCYHPALKADGACRLCLVEVKSTNPQKPNSLTTACTLTVKDGMEILLDTPEVSKHRNTVLEMLMALVPDSPVLTEMAEKYGLKEVRLAHGDEVCVKCGLCVRICDEVVGAKALAMEGRGTETRFNPPFNEPPERCVGCTACSFVCPVQCIPVKRTSDTVTIWGRAFDCLRCERCGRPLDLTGEHMDLMMTRSPYLKPAELKVCDVCSRKEVMGTMQRVVEGQVTLERVGK